MNKEKIKQDNADVLAASENGSSDIQGTSNTGKAVTSFNPGNMKDLPDLNKDMDASPISDISEYWTPEAPGEEKRCFFDSLAVDTYPDDDGEEKQLPVVILWEQTANGVRKITNGSRVLYGHFQTANYPQGTPIQITYKGKKDNKNNSFKSDHWDVHQLFVKVG